MHETELGEGYKDFKMKSVTHISCNNLLKTQVSRAYL
jgi:hypothetical protein